MDELYSMMVGTIDTETTDGLHRRAGRSLRARPSLLARRSSAISEGGIEMTKTNRAPSRQARRDVAAEITQRIIDELDKGVMPWRCNWRRAGGSLPRRHSGEPYRGINLLILALTAHATGYSSPYWMTLSSRRGPMVAQVRKGERSTLVIYYGTAHKREAPDDDGQDGDEVRNLSLSSSPTRVFNGDQIDGLPDQFTPKEEDLDAGGRPIERLEAFFDRMGVPVRIGGDVAAYRPGDR